MIPRRREDDIQPVELAGRAREALAAKKGEGIRLFDVRGVSAVTDFVLTVSGTSAPHLKALSEAVRRGLKDEHVSCYRHAGTPDSGWIVLDYLDVVIHIFSHPARRYYAIEDLWKGCPTPD